MFRLCALLLIVALLRPSLQDSLEDNEIDVGAGLESIVQNFFSSKGGQELGKTLLSMGAGSNANQILDGIGAILGGDDEGKGQIDPSFISGALGLLMSQAGGSKEQNIKDSPILPWILELFAKEGGAENLMSFLPTVLSSISSFVEETGDKEQRSETHWVSVIAEKLQELLATFMGSNAGRTFISSIKQTDALKVFFDKAGNFDMEKLFAMLENHSFRKKGIETITQKITEIGERVFDPSVRPIILMAVGAQANQFLQSRGFPKNANFDMENPIDSLSAMVNYGAKKFLGYQIRSKQYVKPIYKYITGVYNDVQQKGYFTDKKSGISGTLADIINLEIIEPFTRVFRAYRYAKKHSKCDKYVMCLLNKDIVDKSVSLPLVKTWLTRGASLVGSWFISNHTGTPFWTFYSYIMENKDCKKVHLKSCDSFHEEEIKATTKPVHTEL